jgi:hypothetical protein
MNAPSVRKTTARAALEAHLRSRDAVRAIYGAIIGLALVVALGQHPPTAGQTIGALVGTALAVGLAEVYSEFVGAEARERRPLRHSELRELARDALAVVVGAGFPAVFFILAAAGAMDMRTAFTAAKWTGLGLICFYGYFAARLTGSHKARALMHAAALGLIGGGLIVLKALLH